MSIIPDHFLNATVAIGVKADDVTRWIGTGFFVIRNTGVYGVGKPYLVSNRHVFEGKTSVVLRMINQEANSLLEVPASVSENGQPQYLMHPNPNIDIAVLPLNSEFITSNNIAYYAFDIDCDASDSVQLRSNGFNEGSLIYMLGFPLGLVNEGSLTPICRMGCVSRIDESQISETGNYLIDIQNFPGNSGSPIVSRPEVLSIGETKSLPKSLLAGIVHSYIPYQVPLVDAQTGRTVEIREENSGLANVHPVECIREIISQVQSVAKQQIDIEYDDSNQSSDNHSTLS